MPKSKIIYFRTWLENSCWFARLGKPGSNINLARELFQQVVNDSRQIHNQKSVPAAYVYVHTGEDEDWEHPTRKLGRGHTQSLQCWEQTKDVEKELTVKHLMFAAI